MTTAASVGHARARHILAGNHTNIRYDSPPSDAAAISVIKIDVEGFEIRVLDSLRPAWGQLGDILLEVQPSSWRFAGVAIEHGLRTLHELMRARDYVAITLPHRGRDDAAASVARWELSALQSAAAPRAGRPRFDTPLEQGRVQHVDTPRARRPRGVRA